MVKMVPLSKGQRLSGYAAKLPETLNQGLSTGPPRCVHYLVGAGPFVCSKSATSTQGTTPAAAPATPNSGQVHGRPVCWSGPLVSEEGATRFRTTASRPLTESFTPAEPLTSFGPQKYASSGGSGPARSEVFGCRRNRGRRPTTNNATRRHGLSRRLSSVISLDAELDGKPVKARELNRGGEQMPPGRR